MPLITIYKQPSMDSDKNEALLYHSHALDEFWNELKQAETRVLLFSWIGKKLSTESNKISSWKHFVGWAYPKNMSMQ